MQSFGAIAQVVLRPGKKAFGDEVQDDTEVAWPTAWRIPEVNDRVEWKDAGGYVRQVTFDLITGRIILEIR